MNATPLREGCLLGLGVCPAYPDDDRVVHDDGALMSHVASEEVEHQIGHEEHVSEPVEPEEAIDASVGVVVQRHAERQHYTRNPRSYQRALESVSGIFKA